MNSTFNILSAVVLAATVAGCATSQPAQPPASQAERKAANVAYMNCLFPYAHRLDDRRSDAKTIAQAVKGACGNEWELVLETSSRGENDAVKRMMRQQLGSLREDFALQAVLEVRQSQAK